MARKNDTNEPSRRPFGQKLSGFLSRHGSGKSKQTPASTDEKSSGFRFRKHEKALPLDDALNFKPLEVDIVKLEAIRLSDGWLEPSPRNAPDRDKQLPPPPSGSTPIASMFSSISIQDIPNATQHGRSPSQISNGNGKRPFSMVETPSITYNYGSTPSVANHDTRFIGSILDRGRPVEPQHFVTDAPRTKPSWQLPPVMDTTPVISTSTTRRNSTLNTYSNNSNINNNNNNNGSTAPMRQYGTSQLQPRENLQSSNRHSMYAEPSPSFNGVAGKPKVVQSPRSSSAPLDRIQTWQKSVTSAPSSATSSVFAPTSIPGFAPTPSQTSAPARRVSTRGVGNRLAWIKELEEKKSSSVNKDIGVLKKQSGSVSDKLAMFENKQRTTAPPPTRLPPLSRSNSNTSRLSSVGLDSTSSAYGNTTATPRTSIDTVRSSHRNSSVMDNYDDTFREKMESLVSGYNDEDKPDAHKKQKVTTQFVSAKPEQGKGSPSSQNMNQDVVMVAEEPGKDDISPLLADKSIQESNIVEKSSEPIAVDQSSPSAEAEKMEVDTPLPDDHVTEAELIVSQEQAMSQPAKESSTQDEAQPLVPESAVSDEVSMSGSVASQTGQPRDNPPSVVSEQEPELRLSQPEDDTPDVVVDAGIKDLDSSQEEQSIPSSVPETTKTEEVLPSNPTEDVSHSSAEKEEPLPAKKPEEVALQPAPEKDAVLPVTSEQDHEVLPAEKSEELNIEPTLEKEVPEVQVPHTEPVAEVRSDVVA